MNLSVAKKTLLCFGIISIWLEKVTGKAVILCHCEKTNLYFVAY